MYYGSTSIRSVEDLGGGFILQTFFQTKRGQKVIDSKLIFPGTKYLKNEQFAMNVTSTRPFGPDVVTPHVPVSHLLFIYREITA